MLITILVWTAGFITGGVVAAVLMALIAAGARDDRELEIWRD